MSQYKKPVSDDFKKLEQAIKDNKVGNFYIFHGEEHYLRDRYLEMLRAHLCSDGLDGFNYKRFEGSELSVSTLEDAIDAFPVFAERTLIEIHDYKLFQSRGSYISDDNFEDNEDKAEDNIEDNKKENNQVNEVETSSALMTILSNLPDYVCLLFVFNTLPYKPNKKIKLNKEILSFAQVIEFSIQHQSSLIKWITNHYGKLGKRINKADAEYLILITGGYMATLKNEIEKTAAHSKTDIITRSDIDAVVIPILDAITYQLAEALIKRENIKAISILDELLRMREAPQKLLFSISLKMRQLLAARICLDNNIKAPALKDMCGITHDFIAVNLLNTARKTTLQYCKQAVIDCAKAAYDINSALDPESRMIELVAKLAS